jgi:hypothetical protein
VWVILRLVAGVLSIYLTISIKYSFITRQNTLTYDAGHPVEQRRSFVIHTVLEGELSSVIWYTNV